MKELNGMPEKKEEFIVPTLNIDWAGRQVVLLISN
jgi:hypothetical protein